MNIKASKTRGWVQGAMVGIGVIAAVLMGPGAARAESHIEQYRYGDTELATVMLVRDRDPQVQRKLGSAPCAMPAANREAISYFYRSADGKYLRFEINDDGVEAMTMSLDPIVTGVCYAPVGRPIPISTGKGLRLGDSIERVTALYGEPKSKFAVGTLVRFRYDSDAELDRYYEWDLVFRDGRLVEWTSYSRE